MGRDRSKGVFIEVRAKAQRRRFFKIVSVAGREVPLARGATAVCTVRNPALNRFQIAQRGKARIAVGMELKGQAVAVFETVEISSSGALPA